MDLFPIEIGIRHRVTENLEIDLRATSFLRKQGGDGGHIASHAVASDREARRINPNRSAMLSDPRCRGVCLLDGDRISGLRRASILNEHHGCLRASGDLTHEAIVRLFIAQNPPTPVEVHDPWESTTAFNSRYLGQIVTFVGAGEVRSGVGTLASPMGGRCEAAGEQDAGRPKGPHPSSLPPPPLRDKSASLLVSQNTYP